MAERQIRRARSAAPDPPRHIRSTNVNGKQLGSRSARLLAVGPVGYCRAMASPEPGAWEIATPVWQEGRWFFLTVPADVSDDIAEVTEGRAGGFGSVRVEVTCGGTTWQTSLFPSGSLQAYVLPLKKAVRTSEGLQVGETARARLRLIAR